MSGEGRYEILLGEGVAAASKLKPGDPFINGLRVGQFAPGVVRIVFDLKQTVAPQVFSLAPVAAYQHRLAPETKLKIYRLDISHSTI